MRQVITMRDIERLSRESARMLYGPDAVNQPGDLNQCESELLSDPQTTAGNPKTTLTSDIVRDRTNLQLENALRIITAQSASNLPFRFRSEAAIMAGVKGAATLQAAEKEALRARIIQRHEIARAKTRVILWEITERGYALMKRECPKWNPKESINTSSAYIVSLIRLVNRDITQRLNTGVRMANLLICVYQRMVRPFMLKYVQVSL